MADFEKAFDILERHPIVMAGRISETRELRTQVVDLGEPMFGVHGPSGVGKTALAFQFMRRHAEFYPGGVGYLRPPLTPPPFPPPSFDQRSLLVVDAIESAPREDVHKFVSDVAPARWIRQMILVSEQPISKDSPSVTLGPLSEYEVIEIFRSMGLKVSPLEELRLAVLTIGMPYLAKLLAVRARDIGIEPALRELSAAARAGGRSSGTSDSALEPAAPVKPAGFSPAHYLSLLENYESKAVAALEGVSGKAGGIQTSRRFIQSTKLYTRLTLAAISFQRLLPGNMLSPLTHDFWDWPSVACLARNIIETYHALWYLVDPDLSEDDVRMRLILMRLHQNSEKYRLYKEWGAPPEELREFEENLPKDTALLASLPAFAALPRQRQKRLLMARDAMHLSHAEIGESLPLMSKSFRPIYRLFSNQVHSTPFSFDSQSNERGRSFENDTERFYISLAIRVVTEHVCSAVADMSRVFPKEIGQDCRALVAMAEDARTAVQQSDPAV